MLCRVKLLLVIGLVLFPVALFALPQVAVLDAVIPADMDPSVIVPITDKISEELVKSGKYTVLDRASVEQVLKEKEFQLSSGLVKTEEIRKAGEYLGADFVVAARASKVGNTYFVSARMIDVKTGAITSQTSVELPGDLDVLLKLARTAGNRLSGGVVEKVKEDPLADGQADEPVAQPVGMKQAATARTKAAPPRWVAGLKLGGSLANSYGDVAYIPDRYSTFGFEGGVYLDRYLGRAVALELGAYFVQKGLQFDWYDDTYNLTFEWVTESFTFNYLEFPVMLKLVLAPRGNLYIGVGGFASLYLSGTWKDEYPVSTFWNESGDLINIAGTDYGAIASLGFDLRLGNSLLLNVETRYTLALNTWNISTSGYTPKHAVLTVLAGVGRRFGS